MEAQTLTFTIERETKNTVRYQERTAGKPPSYRHVVCAEVVARREPAPSAFRDDSSRATLNWRDACTSGKATPPRGRETQRRRSGVT